MTSLNHDPSQSQQSGSASSAQGARPAVSAEVAQQHDADHWNRQIVAAEQQSAAGRLRIWIIAGVVIVGVVAWLALTR